MSDNAMKSPFRMSPASYGIASMTTASISLASIWLVFNMGPDGVLNNWWFGVFAIGLLPLLGLMCGLVGIRGGFHHKNWLGMIAGAVGLMMSGYEICLAWFVLVAGR